jgi:hypothetical protein
MYESLSDILASEMSSELSLNADFSALTDPQKVQIFNSGQQVICNDYVRAELPDYLVNTTMYSLPS